MKTKTITTAVVIAALVVSAFLFARSCTSDSRLRELKLQYAGYKAIAESDHQMSLDRIGQMTKDIEQRDANILKLEEKVIQKNAKILTLSSQLDELQNQEPQTTPEIESMPIVINLRAQVARLTEMFSLATETINDKDDIIREWEAKFNTQFKITMEWKANYDREHELRVHAEEMFKVYEHKIKVNKFYNKAAVVAVAGAVAYGLLK